MLESVITYTSKSRQAVKGVRRTKSGRFLILADPAGNAKIRINFKPVLRVGDSIQKVATNVDTVSWTASVGGDSLDVTLSSIPHTSGSFSDYGRASDSQDPNFWVSVTFLSGNIVTVPIIARNFNNPLEDAPTTISTATTSRTWAVLSPLVGSDVAFDPTDPTDSVQEILSRPMEIQPLVNSDGANSPDSINVNTATFTYEEETIADQSPVTETPSSAVFSFVVSPDVPATCS